MVAGHSSWATRYILTEEMVQLHSQELGSSTQGRYQKRDVPQIWMAKKLMDDSPELQGKTSKQNPWGKEPLKPH